VQIYSDYFARHSPGFFFFHTLLILPTENTVIIYFHPGIFTVS
jgi:hypothetical protein